MVPTTLTPSEPWTSVTSVEALETSKRLPGMIQNEAENGTWPRVEVKQRENYILNGNLCIYWVSGDVNFRKGSSVEAASAISASGVASWPRDFTNMKW